MVTNIRIKGISSNDTIIQKPYIYVTRKNVVTLAHEACKLFTCDCLNTLVVNILQLSHYRKHVSHFKSASANCFDEKKTHIPRASISTNFEHTLGPYLETLATEIDTNFL